MTDRSSALTGAPTNIFPDDSVGTSGGTTEAVVQLSPGGVWLKAQTTAATIYVPRDMVDPTGSAIVNLTILGACDTGALGGSRDLNGTVSNTFYQIENLPQKNSDLSCNLTPFATRGNLTMDFTATPKTSPRDIHDGYYAYKFKAYAWGGEITRYLNAFKVRADTPNVKMGMANYPAVCEIATFPKSCPPRRNYTDINGTILTNESVVYSSFFGTSDPGGFQIAIRNRCETRGQISFYDLDIDTVSQPSMQMQLLENGVVMQTLPNIGIVNWETGIFGFFDAHPGFSGRDDAYLDIPGGDVDYASLGTFKKDTDYLVRITGVDSSNAIQINASMTTCPDNPPDPEPLTCTSMSVPNNVAPGQVFNVSVTFKNNTASAIGTGDRVSGYHLGITNAGGQDPPDHPNGGQWQPINAVSNLGARYDEPYLGQNYQRMPLNAGVSAGGETTYIFSVTAPNTAVAGKYIGVRILNRTAGLWLDYSATCAKTVNVTQAPIAGSILTGAAYTNCQIISGIARDTDWPGGEFRVHLRFDSSYGANPRPEDAEIFTDANGQWSWVVPDRFKTFSARSIWVDALGKNASGGEDQWVPLTNSGAVSIGPCRYRPTGAITVTCSPNGSEFTITVNATDEDVIDDKLNVALVVNRWGGTENVTGTGSNGGTITLSKDRFTPNYGGDASSRTISGTVTDPRGDSSDLTPAVYACIPIPECSINTISATAGIDFYVTVSLKNNTVVKIPVSGPAKYSVTGASAVSGNGRPYSGGSLQNFPQEIPAGGTMIIRSENALNIPATGVYNLRWDVTAYAGPTPINAISDCGKAEPKLEITEKPYVKFYGNDVVAGGAYGSTCSNIGSGDAKGYGLFGNPADHSTYRGASSELAIFAIGQIDGVLPGSQDINRSPVSALSFSNVSLGTGSDPFGGSFGDIICADNYWASKPSSVKDLTAMVSDDSYSGNLSAKKIDIATLDSDDYEYTGELHIVASGPIPLGKRINIYVKGTTVIGDTSTTVSAITYEGAWTKIDDIPLIRIITLGNMHIDNRINQMDGMFIAMPDPDRPSETDPTGELHTCSSFNVGLYLTNLADTVVKNEIRDKCRNKLVVNGAVIAKKTRLLRINGNIGATGIQFPELYDSTNIAEVFRFSPELYLALISDGYYENTGNFDSLLSLPPAM